MKALPFFLTIFYTIAVLPAYPKDFSSPDVSTLPEKCQQLSLDEVKEICETYGLHQLWEKIENDPPAKPFISDGCSLWIDSWQSVNLYPACFFHDLRYWCGRPKEADDRLMADLILMTDIMEEGLPVISVVMFIGVRMFGPISWGFGRLPGNYVVCH